MTTLNINTVCVKHTPNENAISAIDHDFDSTDYYTFCESCEQNISCFSYYDEDRGTVFTKWSVTL